MTTFACKTRDASGAVVEKTLEAPSRRSAIQLLGESGLVPIRVDEARRKLAADHPAKGSSPGSTATHSGSPRNVDRSLKRKELMQFTLQLESALDAGISIPAALRSASQLTRNPKFQRVLDEVIVDIEGGLSLSSALRNYPKAFPEVYTGTLEAGEQSGKVEEMLGHLAEFLEAEIEIRNDVRSALLYPAIVLVTLCVAIAVMVVFVVPRFADFYSGFGSELPLVTRILVNGSTLVSAHLLPLVLGLGGLLYGLKRLAGTRPGRRVVDRTLLRLPLVGTMLETALTLRAVQLLGLSCQAGLPVLDGLRLVAKTVPNTKYKEDLAPVIHGITTGESLSSSLEKASCFPLTARQMLATGEATGSLDRACFSIAKHYKRDLRYLTKNVSTMIEPLLTVVLAGIVLFVALAVFLPMWDLTKLSRD
ncbi:MAG: MSHA biogenesis protein MshG [Chlamydiales bacterium]|jgi:MSHA biogenesis protein MshG